MKNGLSVFLVNILKQETKDDDAFQVVFCSVLPFVLRLAERDARVGEDEGRVDG